MLKSISLLIETLLMSEKTIKPTMTGDGLQTAHKNGDDLGIVCHIGFTTLIAWFLMRIPL